MLHAEIRSDRPQSLAPAQDPLFLRRRADHYHQVRARNPVVGGHILRGRVPGEGAILLVSNDYLSLAADPRIAAAQMESLRQEGHGVLRSGVFAFGDSPQRLLERHLAAWVEAEDALLSQSGWCANMGLVQSLADEATPVYIDMRAHMSLWEGVKSAGATPRPFRHNDPQSLERLAEKYGPGVVVVDAVYSTSGSVCPLEEMVEVSERHGCVLVVDESHSLGLHGPQGAGLVAALGLAGRVHFRTASLSKTFAARGGIIFGSARNIEYIRYESLPAIFSSCVLVHEMAGFLATLGLIREADDRRVRLRENARRLREGLAELGYPVEESRSQIVPLVAGPEHRTIVLRDALERRGVFGSPFCAPATAKNRSLIRFSVNSGLSEAELERILEVCAEIREEVALEEWPGYAGQGYAAAKRLSA